MYKNIVYLCVDIKVLKGTKYVNKKKRKEYKVNIVLLLTIHIGLDDERK